MPFNDPSSNKSLRILPRHPTPRSISPCSPVPSHTPFNPLLSPCANSKKGVKTRHLPPVSRGKTQLQQRIHPRRHVHHGNHLHTHPRSWAWSRKTIQTELCGRTWNRQTVARDHQKQRQSLLRSRYRHHESPDKRAWEFTRPRLPQSQTGAIGQRTPPSSQRPRRTLWHFRAAAVSGRVTWVPTKGPFHQSTAHAHLRGTRTLGQDHSPHQRRQSL